jgi:hypothetical protein
VTRDELVGKVARRLQDNDDFSAKDCPNYGGICDSDEVPNRPCHEYGPVRCATCWATAIVNLVKDEEEKG